MEEEEGDEREKHRRGRKDKEKKEEVTEDCKKGRHRKWRDEKIEIQGHGKRVRGGGERNEVKVGRGGNKSKNIRGLQEQRKLIYMEQLVGIHSKVA